MARLHEHQGKALLREHGVSTPSGEVVASASQAAAAARRIGGPVVLKAQAWITGRASRGGIVFANDADEVESHAEQLFTLTFGNFPVTELLVEQQITIQQEIFVSLSIDDAAQSPVLLLDFEGGSGIEQRAENVHRLPVTAAAGNVDRAAVEALVAQAGIDASLQERVVDAIESVPHLARQIEARSLEINPLVTTTDGRVLAVDCRITIDDYAVFRHSELGIEIARELDHPPTHLERVAYAVEQNDHRGTFYFAQLPTDESESTRGLVGFHGAGGGGSMMSMDALSNAGFMLANFCDTSGNPSAAKVYRAARIILAQPGLVGYFGSGSGVASQEQFHSAYGLAKAFLELKLDIPAVLRLGGNSEERAIEILAAVNEHVSAVVVGFGKDDTPKACAARFAELVEAAKTAWEPRPRSLPEYVGHCDSFAIDAGRVWINVDQCDPEATAILIEYGGGIFRDAGGYPELAVTAEDAASRDSELIACEIECIRAGRPVLFVDLLLEGIDDDSGRPVGAFLEEKGG